MSIGRKIVALLLFTMGAFLLLGAITYRVVLKPSFLQLEIEGIATDVERFHSAVAREVHHLDAFCYDWAAWDNTYAFAQNGNPDYVESNLLYETFKDNDISLLFVIDLKGHVVWGHIYDLSTGKEMPIEEFPTKTWAVTHPIIRNALAATSTGGVFLTSVGPILLSYRPILKSNDEGPAAGVLLMGRRLDDALIAELAAQTSVSVSVFPIRKKPFESLYAPFLQQIDDGNPVVFEIETDESVYAYSCITDAFDEPALLVQTHTPMRIVPKINIVVQHFLLLMLAGALMVMLALLILLRQQFIHPLATLTSHVTAITDSSELRPVPLIEGKDEIGRLAREFNRMTRRLQQHAEERRLAEEALAENEAQHRAFFDSFRGIAFRGAMDYHPTFCQGATEEITGYTPEQFLSGTPRWVELIHPDDVPAIRDSSQLLRTCPGKSVQREYRILHKDGRVRWIQEAITSLGDEHGMPVAVQGTVYDITEVRNLRERIAQTENLAAIGEMSASVAHEIRNPLAAISGAVQVLRDASQAAVPEREVMDEILASVARMDDTLRSLLAFSKSWVPQKQRCCLADLATDVWRKVAVRAAAQTIEFTICGQPNLELQVDPVLLSQVFWNLFDNAVQAMPTGGSITCHIAADKARVSIRVEDTGEGIRPEDADKVLRPFFTTRTKGTGLGLPICRRIIEAHGGTIAIAGTPGSSTTVSFELPME